MNKREDKSNYKSPLISKTINEQKLKSHNDIQMINQVFNSIQKSEKAIEETLKSIDATMQFINQIDEKEEYCSNR